MHPASGHPINHAAFPKHVFEDKGTRVAGKRVNFRPVDRIQSRVHSRRVPSPVERAFQLLGENGESVCQEIRRVGQIPVDILDLM